MIKVSSISGGKTKALRYNDNKTDWSLVDWRSLEPMVKVLMYGAKKYTPDNWKKGQDLKSLSSCLMRHLVAFMDGEDIDPESGGHHLGHVLCNAMFMIHSQKHHDWADNRAAPKKKHYDNLDAAAEENEADRFARLEAMYWKEVADRDFKEKMETYWDGRTHFERVDPDKQETESIAKKQLKLPFQGFNSLDDPFRYGG